MLFVYISGLNALVSFSIAALLRLPIRICLPKSRASHSRRYVVILRLFFSCGTEVAPWLPGAGTRKMSSAVRRYVAKAKAAEALVHLLFSGHPAGYPPYLNVGPLEQLQRPCLLQTHIRLPVSSIGCLAERHS